MAYSLVASVSAGLGINGGTTGAIDSTGADLIVLVVAEYSGGTSATPTDSKSNTYTEVRRESAGNNEVSIWVCESPTVGSSHTFTYEPPFGFPAVMVYAFSGSASTAADQENSANSSGTSAQPGSVTPSENNELLVSAICVDGSVTDLGVGSSFTLAESEPYSDGVNMGGFSAYKVQTSAGAENPTFSWTTSRNWTAAIATFKAAAGGSSTYDASGAGTGAGVGAGAATVERAATGAGTSAGVGDGDAAVVRAASGAGAAEGTADGDAVIVRAASGAGAAEGSGSGTATVVRAASGAGAAEGAGDGDATFVGLVPASGAGTAGGAGSGTATVIRAASGAGTGAGTGAGQGTGPSAQATETEIVGTTGGGWTVRRRMRRPAPVIPVAPVFLDEDEEIALSLACLM